MKRQIEEKDRLRRYTDNLYTCDEVPLLIKSLCETENRDLFEEVVAEVWEDAAGQPSTNAATRKKYEEEARVVLYNLKSRSRVNLRRITRFVSGIAALFCLVFGSVAYYQHFHTQKQAVAYHITKTSNGEKKNIILPDGTHVVLSFCSSIKYSDLFNSKDRKVELLGEGYFEVARNEKKPFIITTQNFNIHVLGTCFNVKSYPKDEIASVLVKNGKVQVELPKGTMKLTANEQVIVNTLSGEYALERTEAELPVWIKGKLKFNNTPIKEVGKELERMYDCHISFAAGQEFTQRISGEHDSASLETVLQSIEHVSGVKHKREGKKIILYQ